MSSTLETVQSMLIDEYGIASDRAQPGMKLEELGVDSLSTLEFMFLLEDRFKIKFPEDSSPIVTVADIATEVDKALAQSVPSATR
jgi:acyl carrier protein